MLHILMIGHQRRFKIEARMASMSRSLVRRGNQVTLMCVSDQERWSSREEVVDGVTIVESPDLLFGRARSGWDLWCAHSRLCDLRRPRRRYDIIHSHETRPASLIPARSAHRRLRVPWITDWIDWWGRGGLIELQRPWLYRKTLGLLETYFEEAFRSQAQGHTVISHALADRAEGLGIPRDRIEWIPGGCAPEDFPGISKAQARIEEGLPAGVPLILFSGMDVLFDLPLVLRSMGAVRSRFPGARLVVTGASAEVARRLSAGASMPEEVLIARGPLPLDRYRKTLLAADVCVLPISNHQANRGRWPNKIGDYMAAGRPTVTNPVGELEILLRRHEVGLLVSPTSEGFSAGILRLLENAEEARRMGLEARRLAEETFSWSVLGKRLESFYHRILDRFRAAGSGSAAENRAAGREQGWPR